MSQASAAGPFNFPPGSPLGTGQVTFPPGIPSALVNFQTTNPQGPAPDDGSPMPPVPLTAGLWNVTYLNHVTYWIFTDYHFSSGLSVIPTAGPVGSNNRVVRSQAPQMTRVVHWACTSKTGQRPSLPDPQATQFEVLTRARFSYSSPELDSAGAVRSWSAAGYYVYELVAPRTVADGYFAGNPATDTLGFLATQYGTVDFVQGVLGPSPNPAGANPAFASPETGAEGLGLT